MFELSVSIVFFVVGFYVFLRLYLNLKRQANAALAIAVSDFHASANAILKTPGDAPEEVLEFLEHMGTTAFKPGADRRFLKIVRNDLSKGTSDRGPTPLANALERVRPELQKLFFGCVSAWLAIMVNRNVLVGRLIRYELQEVSLTAGKVVSPDAQRAEALRALNRLDGIAA
jgi:hypothetical protein